MNAIMQHMDLVLKFAAAAQLFVALLNLKLVRIMGWSADLAKVQLLVREVFYIHAWFISLTLAIFGVVTWRFASEMAAGANPALAWLAAGIGIFWGVRTAMQVFYYSSSHWRGNPGRTAIHVTLLLLYGGMAAAYLFAAFSK